MEQLDQPELQPEHIYILASAFNRFELTQNIGFITHLKYQFNQKKTCDNSKKTIPLNHHIQKPTRWAYIKKPYRQYWAEHPTESSTIIKRNHNPINQKKWCISIIALCVLLISNAMTAIEQYHYNGTHNNYPIHITTTFEKKNNQNIITATIDTKKFKKKTPP